MTSADECGGEIDRSGSEVHRTGEVHRPTGNTEIASFHSPEDRLMISIPRFGVLVSLMSAHDVMSFVTVPSVPVSTA